MGYLIVKGAAIVWESLKEFAPVFDLKADQQTFQASNPVSFQMHVSSIDILKTTKNHCLILLRW